MKKPNINQNPSAEIFLLVIIGVLLICFLLTVLKYFFTYD